MKPLFHATIFGLWACAGAVSAQAADENRASRFEMVGRIPGPDGRWDLVSIDAEARRLYVAHGDAVTAVDLETNEVTPVLAKSAHAHGVLPLRNSGRDTQRVAVTNADTNSLTIFQGNTGKVVGEIKTGKYPDAMVQDPASGLIYVMNHKGGDISVIDPGAMKNVDTIRVGGALELAVLDGKGHLYVNVEDKNEVAQVDLATRAVKHIALKGCVEPTGIGYDPSHDLLVSACDGFAAVVLGGENSGGAAIGDGADGVIFDTAHNQFLIPNGASGTLSVLAVQPDNTLKLIDTVKTQIGARTAALDPKSGKLYLPTAKLIPGANGKLEPVPGTFEILMLARNK